MRLFTPTEWKAEVIACTKKSRLVGEWQVRRTRTLQLPNRQTKPDEAESAAGTETGDVRVDDKRSLECGFRTLMSRVWLREARQARLFEGSA